MSGALGTGGTANSPAPSCVDALPGDPTQVACGDGFSACVTAAGELYTWGQGRDGRLGHGDSSDSIYPRKVECEGVVSVGLGHCHAIAVTRAGGVLAWGRGFAGQLGLGDGKSHWKPERLDLSGVTPPLDDVRVVAAACGGSHSALLLASGEVLAFGRGDEGQLGDGQRSSSKAPVRLALPEGAKAKAVACGRDFTVVLLEDARVFCTGSDQYGQLGGGRHALCSAAPVEAISLRGEAISSVACGDLHAAAVSADGRIFTWGYGRAGQLGLGNTVDVAVPKEVQDLRGVASVACGRNHTVAVTRGGEALAWGRGRDGQLGRGGELESPTAYRTTPVRVEALRPHLVLSVACGATHTLARVLSTE